MQERSTKEQEHKLSACDEIGAQRAFVNDCKIRHDVEIIEK